MHPWEVANAILPFVTVPSVAQRGSQITIQCEGYSQTWIFNGSTYSGHDRQLSSSSWLVTDDPDQPARTQVTFHRSDPRKSFLLRAEFLYIQKICRD